MSSLISFTAALDTTNSLINLTIWRIWLKNLTFAGILYSKKMVHMISTIKLIFYGLQTTFTDQRYIFSPLQTEIIKKNRKILEVFSQNKRREVNNRLILQETRETVTEILTRND